MKLNLGCGDDYREGYVNIDGNEGLRTDLVFDLAKRSLTEAFSPGTIEAILANDVFEHLHHWEAVRLLRGCRVLLRPGGCLELRVPDAKHILESKEYSTESKLVMLYGGQDTPQGVSKIMDTGREKHPEYFCHRFGWTPDSMTKELQRLGFERVVTQRAGMNMVVKAYVG